MSLWEKQRIDERTILYMWWCIGIQGQSLISTMVVRHMIILSCFVILEAQLRVQAIEYEVINKVGNSSTGGVRFTNEIGIQYSRETLEAATEFIWGVFQESTPAERKTVEKISLIIDNRSGYVSDHNEIYISADYIGSYPGDVKKEITGTVYHGMTHIWQWNGNGQAPGGLIEGIADFVRLQAKYAASFWVQPGEGDRWNEGYDVTAWFLDYCNSLRDGFVAELNKKMRSGYSPDFFVELLGKTVDQLWADYKAKYKSYSTPCENQVIWIF